MSALESWVARYQRPRRRWPWIALAVVVGLPAVLGVIYLAVRVGRLAWGSP